MRPNRSALRALRGVAVATTLSLALTGVSSPWTIAAAAAIGPSIPLPDVPSTPVAQQTMTTRAPDEASTRALRGDQSASTTPDGESNSAASPLSPSATWSVSAQSGTFTWSYPLRVPPAPGGLDPQLALGYSSSEVDGRTSATNNQASWAGDGWSIAPGFVERAYGSCAADTEGGTTPPKTGDLCWHSDNATASYGSAGGQLIRDDATGAWHPKDDDGSRVERLTGAGNGDNDGEYWKITKVDGTQYFFGSSGDAKSAWTVPVYGDDAGEPCHAATFEASHCVQTWRWNLDKVVDRNGNEIRYTYTTETNSYGMDLKDAAVPYVRGGALARVEYGLRDGDPAPPTGRVLFTTADRCVPGSDCTSAKPANWPDVPWDDNCAAATCKDHYVPTFWTTQRLAKITTQVRRGTDFADVDSWTLDHQFPDPGDGGKPALWLKGITHTGLVGGSASLPPVTFEGTKLANRVTKVDGVGPLIRYRLTGIVSETGGVTSIHYAPPDCTGTAAPETNTQRCFQTKWTKKDWAERTDWFHKYVVDSVTTSDRISANPEQVVRYEYLDGAAWHFDQSEFVKDDKKTWDEFRGYGRVRVHTGKADDPSGPVTMTEQRFYRGMDGDHLPAGTRSAAVTDSEGVSRADSDWLSGFPFEQQTHDGEGDTIVTKSISAPVWQGPTATRGVFKAYLVGTGSTTGYTALRAGGRRTTKTETAYDDKGLPVQVNDLGDMATPSDDLCSRTTYARNTGAWLLNLPSRVETVSVHCGATPVFPDNAVSDDLSTFDDHGNVVEQEVLDQHPGADPVRVTKAIATYDTYGRLLSATNALGNTAKTEYTGSPVTTTKVTNALGQATTTALEPAWGTPVRSADTNDRITETAYDALGRTTETWLPNRPRESNAGNGKYTYLIRNDGPSAVTTSAVGPNGNYSDSVTLYDGLARVRQVQKPTQDGRLLVDTRYDSQGREVKTTQPYYNGGAVNTNLWVASDTEVPGLTVTQYDGAGRVTASISKASGVEKWRTTTAYGGDRVDVTPPAGGTPTTTVADARGRRTELWQYHGGTPDGEHDTTRYGYSAAGKLTALTDPAGNTWRWTFDLQGRLVKADDVDKGTSTRTYDAADRLASVTDARNVTLAYAYDALGRKTETHTGTASGPLLEKYTYDSAMFGKGRPAAATRYVGGNAYTTEVGAYSPLYQPLQATVTIPQSEGLLAGSYPTYRGYNPDGSLKGDSYAAAAGVPAESVLHVYDDFGRPTQSSGGYDGTTDDFVTDTNYTRYGEPQRLQLGDPGKRVWLSNYYDTNTRRLSRSIVDAEVPAPMQDDVNYTYDPAGNITSVVDAPQGKPADVQCFGYDYLRRLTEAWTPSGGCGAAKSASGLGGPAPYWQSFTYDKVGNRLSAVQHTTSGDTTRTSTYPAAGHLLQSVKSGTQTAAYGYDADGNTITRPGATAAQQLEWDAEGHLTKVMEGASATEFLYDALGTRLLRRDPAGTTLYLGNEELRVDKATAKLSLTRYYTHGGSVVATRTAKGITWVTGDHQGTPQTAVDSVTLQVTNRRQTPFGAQRGTSVSMPGDRGFVGGTDDVAAGLTGIGAREYDAATGRFLSVDPVLDVTDPQQANGYAYANNTPVTNSDPTGLMNCGPDNVGCGGIKGDPKPTPEQKRNWWQSVYNAPPPSAPKPRNRSNCPDGDLQHCHSVQGSVSGDQVQERNAKVLKGLEDKLRPVAEKLHLDYDKLIGAKLRSIGDLLDKLAIRSGSFCLEGTVGLIVAWGFDACVNFDGNGFTFSGSTKHGIIYGAEASLDLAVRVNTASADSIWTVKTDTTDIGADTTFGIFNAGVSTTIAWPPGVPGGTNSYEFKIGLGTGFDFGAQWRTESFVQTGYW
ncbi:RHS repeat-containing protein [Amycolatopsis mediterranei S699]|uniref:RHS repeat-containing protein n=2 Tax=Amycolatopsis mediterranei TaxID=33910 RepID=A0A0H3D3L2_AMYMU|nr:RHS repeat-associated core domain-containing protein [Amycolatopsis mediterranei]ADJ45580.1 RHS repeat-containing protein [Amycolatopsis mediterranei U32]AEK42356.1 RHS repeat-containing protein [Amycolatopsis mediterranei S699]AFO77292.1 RHS repeat-containing protein [Amycolatopsis mediterranei S699]KDO05838.1 type IV secretion protein Rhs [Amycolatopsis mediterranei]KDU88925.1 type IV secretion protein Rhs [Amycolatopsis mediterranei]